MPKIKSVTAVAVVAVVTAVVAVVETYTHGEASCASRGAGQYVLGALNSNSCPGASVAVQTEADCRSFASSPLAANKTFSAVISSSGTMNSSPRGCYRNVVSGAGNGSFFFNPSPTGGTSATKQPICLAVTGTPAPTIVGDTDPPTAAFPTTAPPTGSPTASPTTAPPTGSPAAALPTTAPPTGSPTAALPTTAPPTGSPTASPTTAPTIVGDTNPPTTALPTTTPSAAGVPAVLRAHTHTTAGMAVWPTRAVCGLCVAVLRAACWHVRRVCSRVLCSAVDSSLVHGAVDYSRVIRGTLCDLRGADTRAQARTRGPRVHVPRRMARHRARPVVQGSMCWALSIRTPALARRWPFRPRRTAGASHRRRLRPTKPFRVSSVVIVPCARRREAATATSLPALATAVSISTRVPPAEPVLRNSPSALLTLRVRLPCCTHTHGSRNGRLPVREHIAPIHRMARDFGAHWCGCVCSVHVRCGRVHGADGSDRLSSRRHRRVRQQRRV